MPVVILIGFAQVIAKFPDRLLHSHFAILIRPLDIAEGNHLLHGFMGGHRIESRMWRMATVRTRYVLPSRYESHFRALDERLREYLAIHVLANWQAVHRQNCRG